MIALSESAAREERAFLNVARVGRDAYVGRSQERTHRHFVDLEAVALLQPRARDEPLERPMYHFWPVETESRRPELASHIEERPSCGCELVFLLVKIQAAINGYPTIRIQLALGVEKLRESSAFFNQNASGGDQLFGLSSELGQLARQLTTVPTRNNGLDFGLLGGSASGWKRPRSNHYQVSGLDCQLRSDEIRRD
jgi:hypothetical protein